MRVIDITTLTLVVGVLKGMHSYSDARIETFIHQLIMANLYTRCFDENLQYLAERYKVAAEGIQKLHPNINITVTFGTEAQ